MIPRAGGRPRLAQRRVKFTTTLPQDVIDILRRLGEGNASAAIIRLARAEKSRLRDADPPSDPTE